MDAGRDEPRIVLQSSGAGGSTSFEDAYLARYLGYPLVEGGDLAVRDDRLWLKTLGGLVPLDVVLRRVADRDCDPLELDPAALEGTPGLVQVVRRGRVAIANGLGSGLVESPALAEYLPAVSRRLLGEDLVLGGPRSWWCGDPANLALVSLSPAIAMGAARLRARYRLRLPDAIQLATALHGGAVALVSHDNDFAGCSELPVLTACS